MKEFLKKSFDDAGTVVRYVISGLVGGMFTNMAVFYVATHYFNIWYLWSSVLSFFASLAAAFLLQKYWTFKGGSAHRTHKQLVIYSVIAVCGQLFNMAALYILVGRLRLWALGSQAFILGIIAFTSFLINKNHTFKKKGEIGDIVQ